MSFVATWKRDTQMSYTERIQYNQKLNSKQCALLVHGTLSDGPIQIVRTPIQQMNYSKLVTIDKFKI